MIPLKTHYAVALIVDTGVSNFRFLSLHIRRQPKNSTLQKVNTRTGKSGQGLRMRLILVSDPGFLYKTGLFHNVRPAA
jgi:hypothetical protein